MSNETKSPGFIEHHQWHVRTTFQYVDNLVSSRELP